MILFNILILILFSFILIKSAEWVIVALRRIAKRSNISIFAISAILMAIGTSLPEMFIGITSALEGVPGIALGVVIGSNIINTALITGLVSLFMGRIGVHGEFVKKDVFLALVAGLLPLALMADGVLGRADGLILLFGYAAYVAGFFKDKFSEVTKEHNGESFFYKFLREINHINFDVTKEYAKLFVGLALLLFSAEQIIGSAKVLAAAMNVPVFVVALLIVSIGTTLPELVFSIKSIKSGEPKMFFGNLLGSTIANSTLIIGITAVISPITIVSFVDYRNAIITFVVIFITFWAFIRTKHRLDRWEALILLLMYFTFVVIEFIY